jgi:transaldolase
MRGIERRIEAGLRADVASVASIFISRWDVAVTGKVPKALNDRLGIAVATRAYKAYLGLLSSPRWMRAYNAGARPQRLLWASTGTKDPEASDVLYVKSLAAPFTVNTMPEGTLKALADHGEVGGTLRGSGTVRRCEDRRRCIVETASRRGCQVLRQVLERADWRNRLEIRSAQASELAR